MNKIPTLFKRNPQNLREILDEPHPDCLWVFANEGVATRKYNGTCVKIEGGEYWKRREIRDGKPKPYGFVDVGYDPVTQKRVGWIEVDNTDPSNKWHMVPFRDDLPDGTYELIGQKIQGNPEHIDGHKLIRHADADRYDDVPCTFQGLRDWLKDKDIEGLVFHHPDGRMAKIKKRDYGLARIPRH